MDLFELSLEELLSIKINVANRAPTEIVKAPSSVSLFTSTQIDQMGLRTLEELLPFIPGFQVVRGSSGGGHSSVSVRGRSSSEASNGDLLILMDGIRLNEPRLFGALEQERQISLYNVLVGSFDQYGGSL